MKSAKFELSILGCGWFGQALAQQLLTKGYLVKGSTTTPEKCNLLKTAGVIPFLVDFKEDEEKFDPVFFDSAILFICIPPKRSTAEQHTYLSKVKRIASAASAGNVKHVVFISSTSVYANSNTELDENTIPEPETDSGNAILSAELFLKNITSFDTTVIRFAGLFGPGRDPGRFFAGKSDIPNGNAPVNLIHLTDCIGLSIAILEQQSFGFTYNACAPQHPSRSNFYRKAIQKSGLEKASFKDELLSWKQVNSIMIPKQLNYHFKVDLDHIV